MFALFRIITKIGQFEKITISSKVWAKIEELNRGRETATNPVFVAMWFGGKKKKRAMTLLYDRTIKPAVESCGYKAARSDMEEHNDDIMDHIRAQIRDAPFIVADLTEPNLGVYYEAGLASGHGKTVIHCCPENKIDDVHFDLNHRNLVAYSGSTDLRRRLARRIRAHFEQGPFPVEEQPAE